MDVNLFYGVLTNRLELLPELIERLVKLHGDIDFQSEPQPFDMTDYYNAEMGEDLTRTFISFENIVPVEGIYHVKDMAADLEDEFKIGANRVFNLDPGYLDFFKVVLLSYKEGWHKVYLVDGVWADPTLYYYKGNYYPFHWSFPDFKAGYYNDIFQTIRQLYKQKVRH